MPSFLSLGQFITSPMLNFTCAKVTFSEHDKLSAHRMGQSGCCGVPKLNGEREAFSKPHTGKC